MMLVDVDRGKRDAIAMTTQLESQLGDSQTQDWGSNDSINREDAIDVD
jgi:hypothetical protein